MVMIDTTSEFSHVEDISSDIRIIKALNCNQAATIRVDGSTSKKIEIHKRHSSRMNIVSHLIGDNVYSKSIFKEALEASPDCGVITRIINGQNINSLRYYVDDTIIIATRSEDLLKMLTNMNIIS